jgi:protein-histidine N-methyltransferase
LTQLGCGTALPTLVLFHYAITQSLPLDFTLSDYNFAVLQLVTVPNLLLTYASTLPAVSGSEFSVSSPNPLANLSDCAAGDLDITPGIIASFLNDLNNAQINVNFICGSWSPAPQFLALIPTARDVNTFVLASETIYSPTALESFTTVLVGVLKAVRLGKGVIAAKRVYFGVGGSVDAFKVECAQQGAVASEIDNHGVDLGEGQGIRRCLIEVQML